VPVGGGILQSFADFTNGSSKEFSPEPDPPDTLNAKLGTKVAL